MPNPSLPGSDSSLESPYFGAWGKRPGVRYPPQSIPHLDAWTPTIAGISWNTTYPSPAIRR